MYGDRLSQEPDRECHNYLHNLFPEPDRNLFFDGILFWNLLVSVSHRDGPLGVHPSIRILLHRSMFVSSNLHVRGFSSHRISKKIHSCLAIWAIGATPATQSEGRCHQVPRLPRSVTVDVSKCHTCHANSHGDHGGKREPSAPPEPATQSEGPTKCHACDAEFHACHAK